MLCLKNLFVYVFESVHWKFNLFTIFLLLLGNVSRSFSNLDNLELDDVLELLETTQDILDELWKQDEHKPYLEVRMRHTLEIMAG